MSKTDCYTITAKSRTVKAVLHKVYSHFEKYDFANFDPASMEKNI